MENDRLNDILMAYETYPMQDGDAVVLLVEERVATEIEGLADAWDPTLRRNLAQAVRELDSREILLGIARPHGVMRERDRLVVAELRQELAGTGVLVHPLVPLPAAA